MAKELRQLDYKTLDMAARDWAGMFLSPSTFSLRSPEIATGGRDWVVQSFKNIDFKDEYDYLIKKFKDQLGKDPLKEFNKIAEENFTPRAMDVFEDILAHKLAITPYGEHIEGKIGSVIRGARYIGDALIEVETPASNAYRKYAKAQGRDPGPRQTMRKLKPQYWNVFAGEVEERASNSGVVDLLPDGSDPYPVDILEALNTRISNECALLGANAIVDNLDEGTGAAVIQGRSGAQPADPDTVVAGTLLFTLVCSDPSFGVATDANPGALKTADTITDDSSADATETLGYCRASSTNDGSTPLDDHIDGEAGTSGADFNFNTLAIVSGAVVSVSSWLITLPES